MQRTNRSLALLGITLALAACGQQASKPSDAPGSLKGKPGIFYVVTVSTPVGGKVTSTDGQIDCGKIGTTVTTACSAQFTWGVDATFSALPDTAAADPFFFQSWAGDCGSAVADKGCVVSVNGQSGADKFVAAVFNVKSQLGHQRMPSGVVHGPMYFSFLKGEPGAIQCTRCHGADLKGNANAPSCAACHALPPGVAATGMHFDGVNGLAWQMHGTPGTGWSQACQRCHTSQGFQDYVGAIGQANNLSGSFNVNSTLTTDTTVAAYAYGPLQCETCHNTTSDPLGTYGGPGLTSVLFPSLAQVATDNRTGICANCHGARESAASLNAKITANVASASKGIGSVTATALTSGTSGTTTTLVAKAGSFTAGAYMGYTAIFTGSVTSALNGVRVAVQDNTTDTLTFANALPAAPGNTLLPLSTIVAANESSYPFATGGSTTTLENTAVTFAASLVGSSVYFQTGLNKGAYAVITAASGNTITFAALPSAVAAGDRYLTGARSSDTAILYPTATGGTTSTLVDANRTWTANAFTNFYVFFQTGANAGLYRLIASNTATTLTLTGALATAPVAGDLYEILPVEDYQLATTTAPDAQLASGNSFTNGHYMGAAATMFGSDAAGWYQYPRNAAATIPGAYAVYTGTNYHGVSAGSCVSCHDPHGLEVNVSSSTCGRCHFKADGTPVTSLAELEDVRQFGFEGDIDGQGTESLKNALANNGATLLTAIQTYAEKVSGTKICYNQGVYSYFFVPGTDACGTGNSKTGYNKFTPRLLRAAYNYNFFMREPNGWAHNPRYVAEILFDAISDLNAGLAAKGFAKVPFAGARTFGGHFGAADATFPQGGDQFRDWDNGVVSNSCSQCHAGQVGLERYLANPWTAATNKPVTGMQCTTCHAPLATDTDMKRLRAVDGTAAAGVRFPPRSSNAAGGQQAAIVKTAADFDSAGDALCATCHSGRETKASIDFKTSAAGVATGGTTTSLTVAAGSGWGTDSWKGAVVTVTSGANVSFSTTVSASTATSITWVAAAPNPMAAGDAFTLSFDSIPSGNTVGPTFVNPHYFGAAATVFGSDTHVWYEYANKTYAGKFGHSHTGNVACVGCHDPKASRHTFEAPDPTVETGTACSTCHADPVMASYGAPTDATLAAHKANFAALATQLYTQLRLATVAAGVDQLCYSSGVNPYFFREVAGVCQDGVANAPAASVSYRFNTKLLRAAFNYQWSQKEPNAWVHNYTYAAQALYDSIQDLGGTPSVARP